LAAHGTRAELSSNFIRAACVVTATDARVSPVLLWSLTIALTLAVIEAASYGMVHVLASKAAVYSPPQLRDVERYLRARDPVLGWPSPQSHGGKPFDRSGARVLPAFPEPANACVAAYGDSFVFADEVDDAAAWTNQLALSLGCRVANFGVNGYGTDQAYLRMSATKSDESRHLVLGVFTHDIVRNVNQLRNLLAPTDEIGLKPRYVIDEHDDMQLLVLPDFAGSQFADVMRFPEKYLPHDYFVPGGPAGVVRAEFPFTLAVARSLTSYKLAALLRGRSPYEAFYEPRHPSMALDITARLCGKFASDAAARGKTALVVMFPSRQDLEQFAATGRWIYQPLLDRLGADGQPTLNLGPALLAALGEREPAALFKILHYNEEGNRVVAAAVERALGATSTTASHPHTSTRP
jgi:hypothetical protein